MNTAWTSVLVLRAFKYTSGHPTVSEICRTMELQMLQVISDSSTPTDKRVSTALLSLKTLPFARAAILECFSSIYDDAMFRQLTNSFGEFLLLRVGFIRLSTYS